MNSLCKLQYLDSKSFLIQIRPFLVALLEDINNLEKVYLPLKSAGVTYRIFLSAIKIYKMMLRKRDSFLVNYENHKSKATLEFYNSKKYKFIDTRIPKGYNHKSMYEKFEQTSKDYVLYEKSVIREIYNCEFTLLMGCFIVASKMYNDISFTNESWEPVTKISCRQINLVEKIILEVLDYDLFFEGENVVQNEINLLLNIGIKKRKGIIKRMFCVK
ncbi:hypothetical protein EHP00_1791 [Ecytonucleospora hepatopenaei]|uniref:Cyclin N-terminal domain-containing protein n=1 Tax=Ecytonucleospora hepatopenaei TaxID=646526 RepID=A0A1W0E4C8_9MICR|nr:hypothetical protein EHP00_1791 [Ecytonucleospora hepatopenaei]